MNYRRFELLVMLIASAAVLASVMLATREAIVVEEILAQLILLAVVAAALHWGRTGGTIAAGLGTAAYLSFRIPLAADAKGITGSLLTLMVVRILSYALVGIMGGELSTRVKALVERLSSSSHIDEWSEIHNHRFISRALETAAGQFDRYDTPYTVILVELTEGLTAGFTESKQRALVRGVASHVRADVRLVDEVGRLEDGSFVVILPHTTRQGAAVVAARLHQGVCEALGARSTAVSVDVLSPPDDTERLAALRASLHDGSGTVSYSAGSGS